MYRTAGLLILVDRVIGSGFRHQLIPDEQNGADGDRRIGDVERRPVVAGDMPLDEIDDRSEADAVDDVAERAAEHQGERQREPELARYAGAACVTIQTETPSASTVKNQRCQPPASDRKLNAAPLLKVSTQLKNGAT